VAESPSTDIPALSQFTRWVRGLLDRGPKKPATTKGDSTDNEWEEEDGSNMWRRNADGSMTSLLPPPKK
jgi:hypothetical protein